MSKLLKIKINDPQPVECPECRSFSGYQYSDLMTVHYTCFHDSNGKHEGGAYSEGPNILNRGVSAFCCNCGTRLPFKLIRNSDDQL